MAIITYPLNNIDYEAADAELYNSTRTSGVYANEDNLDCSITGDREITISPGMAWIKNDVFAGKAIGVTERVILTFDIADGVLDRIDRVVLQFDAAANGTSLIIKKGGASSAPAAPERVVTASLYELVLYDVSIPHGMTSLSSANIVDQRTNDELCGLMRDGVTRLPMTTGTINGKPIGGAITLSAADVGAYPLRVGLESIGCSAASTMRQVYEAMPDASMLIVSWCGTSVAGFSGTTFGDALPHGYGSLYLRKPNSNATVGDALFVPYIPTDQTYTPPFCKTMILTSSGWRETGWVQGGITGAASTIAAEKLPATQALISDRNGNVYYSSVTSGELYFLLGATSNIQEQLDGKMSAAVSTGTLTFSNSDFTNSGSALRKTGNLVCLYVSFTGTNQTVSGTICTVPAGFRPAATLKSTTHDAVLSLSTGGAVTLTGGTSYKDTSYGAVFVYDAAN